MPPGNATAVPLTRRANGDAILVLGFAGLACVLGGLGTRWPQESIAVAIGLLVISLMIFDLALGVVIYVLAAFTFLGGKPNVATALTVLLAFGWVAGRSGQVRLRPRPFREVPLLAAVAALFGAWVLIATLWAGDPAAAHGTALRLTCDLLLLPVIYAAVRDERRLHWILLAIIVAGGVAAVTALVIPPSQASQYGTRAQGLIGDPNTLAANMLPAVVLAPLLWMRGITGPQSGTRVLVLACAAASLAATISTGSRGAVLALAAVLLLTPLVLGRWRRAAFTAITVGGAVGYVALGTLASPDAREHLGASTSSGRGDMWTIAQRMVHDHPLGGVGTGNFTHESIHYLIRPGRYEDPGTTSRQLSEPLGVHNSYLQVWAEYGAVGLALYLMLLTAAVACGIRAARIFRRLHQEGLELAARGLVLAAGGLAVSIWFLTYIDYGRPVWVVLSLLVAVHGLALRMDRDTGRAR
jgi:O-antigen ligase